MTMENGNDADYRLPRVALPRRYVLDLSPDLRSATFTGRVSIELDIVQPVTEIVCNAAELSVSEATLRPSGAEAATALGVRLDEPRERVTFTAPAVMQPGSYVLECAFAGVLNDKLRGFYRSRFTDPSGKDHWLATTHFESTDARRAFPCFDEPDLKAVFSVSIDIEEDLFAVSNSAEVSVTPTGDGRKRIVFADTIVMSTYLVCVVVGALEASEPEYSCGTPIRVITPIGKLHLAPFALEVAVHALAWYTDYFDLPYPGSKLDLVDIPDFGQGAMENLGCVTFRETDLLCDPATASVSELTRIAEVIEHEIAHMWFGDLVTMKWWNGIWLNEAFATFMSICCLDDFRPEWRRWVSFGREKDYALTIDALHSTRPIEFDVRAPDEAEAMFDALTYLKGGNVLRMLEQYLGTARFRAGVRRYLAAHQFANTETTDLWDAIESAAEGEPVRALMDSWLFQGGTPLVTARRIGDELELTEEPFSLLPRAEYEEAFDEPSAIGHDWIIPIRVAEREGGVEPLPDGGPGEVQAVLLGPPPHATQPLVLPIGDGLTVVNAGGSGTYRLRYHGPLLEEICANLASLTALERFNLVSDTWATTLARVSPLDDFLALADSLRGEDDPNVWAVVIGAFGMLDLAVAADDRRALEQRTRGLFGPELERLGFAPGPGDTQEMARARSAFISVLGTIGADEEVRAEAHAAFDAAQHGGEPLPGDTAEAILQVAAYSGGRAEFELMRERVLHPIDPIDQSRHLFAIASTRVPALAAELREMCLDEVRAQDAPYVLRVLLGSRANGPATWDFITRHWEGLKERFATHAVPSMLGGISRLADLDPDGNPVLARRVEAFLAEHPLGGHQRTIQQHLERLDVNVGFVREQRPTLGELLAKS
ncbi:MAG TPA: M1 family metallopeptidase [Acidimicrobiales bacterium]|nr:M1 family metallopeptidase [Acidimicrobiales bacterium]